MLERRPRLWLPCAASLSLVLGCATVRGTPRDATPLAQGTLRAVDGRAVGTVRIDWQPAGPGNSGARIACGVLTRR